MPHGNEKANHNWSSLPVLLLWMIKDKLDSFDDMSLSAVCRDWWTASSSYPKKKSIGDKMPWIMQVNKTVESGLRDIISITRNKKFTLDLPESSGALVLFSKQGWILMRRKNLSESKERLPDSLFLINPFTKAKIEMPDVADPFSHYHGSFSIHEGYPQRVVLLKAGLSCQVTLRTAYPGDVAWSEHSYTEQPMQIDGRCGLITVGEKVYYLNLKENMIIYNMTTRVWKELPGPGNEIGRNYIPEHEGNIVKLFARGNDHSSYTFCKYNDANTSWESLNDDDVKDTSWYLSRSGYCLSAREKGLKVFLLRARHGVYFRCRRVIKGFDVRCHDFVDGGTQTLELRHRICSSAKWVDIG